MAEDWRIHAAEWLRNIADVADAEGLTSPEIIEDRIKLAELLEGEAKRDAAPYQQETG